MIAEAYLHAVRMNEAVAVRGGEAAAEAAVAGPEKFRVEDLSVRYGSFVAIDGIHLGLRARCITALIGPSGCGKSTMLRALNRMNDAIPGCTHEGRVLLDGIDIYADRTDVVELRTKVGMLFQRPNPFPMSVFANVAYGPRIHGLRVSSPGRKNGTALADWVEECLRKAALWDEVKDKLRGPALALSGGQQQRLCLARALAVEPEVLLMDEPCSALDPIATVKIEDLMHELEKQYTIVIVTHNMQQAARVSDYTGFFWVDEHRTGRLVEFDQTHKIFTNPSDPRTEAYVTGRMG